MENPRVFLDINIGARQAGRLVFELFFDITPKTAENFRELCTGERAHITSGNAPLHYKGCAFHRIIGNFMAQGGDFTRGDGSGGVSIYGARFADEDFTRKHEERGLLSMANAGPNTNGSQFFITFAPAPHLDNRHVVFGKIVEGFEVLAVMEKVATDPGDRPRVPVTISDCGQLGVEDDEPPKTAPMGTEHQPTEEVDATQTVQTENAGEEDDNEQEEDIEEKMEGMTDTQKRLFKLRLKLNKGRKENKKEAREEYKRFNDPKYEQKQRSQEYREKKRNWEEQMKEHGLEPSESFMFETASSAETQHEKAKKKEKNRNSFGWAVYTQDALYKSHKKRISKLGSTAGGIEEGGPSLEENPMNYGRTGKVNQEGVQRLVQELERRDATKKKYSRRRPHLEGTDVDYINKANEHYNKKIKRAFDKYTAETAQNLERGTAV